MLVLLAPHPRRRENVMLPVWARFSAAKSSEKGTFLVPATDDQLRTQTDADRQDKLILTRSSTNYRVSSVLLLLRSRYFLIIFRCYSGGRPTCSCCYRVSKFEVQAPVIRAL